MAYNAKLNASPRYTLAIGAAERANRKFDSWVELRIAPVQAEDVIRKVPWTLSPLGGGVNILDPLEQRFDGLGAAIHTRSIPGS